MNDPIPEQLVQINVSNKTEMIDDEEERSSFKCSSTSLEESKGNELKKTQNAFATLNENTNSMINDIKKTNLIEVTSLKDALALSERKITELENELLEVKKDLSNVKLKKKQYKKQYIEAYNDAEKNYVATKKVVKKVNTIAIHIAEESWKVAEQSRKAAEESQKAAEESEKAVKESQKADDATSNAIVELEKKIKLPRPSPPTPTENMTMIFTSTDASHEPSSGVEICSMDTSVVSLNTSNNDSSSQTSGTSTNISDITERGKRCGTSSRQNEPSSKRGT